MSELLAYDYRKNKKGNDYGILLDKIEDVWYIYFCCHFTSISFCFLQKNSLVETRKK